MKLIYPEADIVPGRPGQRPQVTPVREEQPLPGSSVIRLTNTTSQENAYTVRLRCEERFWQDAWYTVVALPPGQGAENAPPPGKPDQRGPQDRWVKIYVPRGGTRDVLIRFNVPSRPESRAGKYGYFVEVETQVIGPTDSGRRKDRVSQIPGTAIIRPYYKWSVDLSPEERRVGRRHHSADFDVVVTNEGNDWLYCDMQLPRPKDMVLDCPTLRLAVPPPEPGETLPALPGDGEARPGTQRAVPLTTATKLKVFRGDVTRQPIQVSAQRVDAPSVPPPASDGYAGLGAVVAAPTTEKQQVSGDRALVYHPPVPAKFTDFFSRGAGSLRTLAMGGLAIVAAFTVGILLWQNAFYQGVKVEPNSLTAEPGGTLLVSGQFLQGSRLFLGYQEEKTGSWSYETVNYHPKIANLWERVVITDIPKDLDHKQVKVKAQRFVGLLPFLTSLLPSSESKSLVQVGSQSQAPAVAAVDAVDPGPYKAGSQFTISGRNLGTSGAVLVNNLKAKSVWASDKVTVTVSPAAVAGSTLPVVVEPQDSVALQAGSIQVAPNQVATVPGGAAPGGGKPAGGGAPAGGKPAGGGGAAAGGKPAGGGGAPAGGKPTAVSPPNQPSVVVPRPSAQQTAIVVPRPPTGLGTPPYDLVLAGSYPAAIGAASDRLKLHPNDAESLALQAYAMIKIGQAGRAQPLVSRALSLSPSSGRARSLALVAKGALDAAQGQTGAATSDFQQAGNAAENLGLPYLALADFLPKVHQEAEIKPLLQEALTKQLQPNEASAIQAKIAGQ